MPTADALPVLPERDPQGHKGTFGTVAVVGGSAHTPHSDRNGGDGSHMVGGPAFSAAAALRAGCGLARLVMPEPVLDSALCITPSATGRSLAVDADGDIVGHLAAPVIDETLRSSSCVAIGPGLGTTPGAQAVTLRCTNQEQRPIVIDADGLNCLAEVPELHRDFRAAAILTPHPGEFARLASALGVAGDVKNPDNRPACAERLAQKLGCIVVLKAATTVVSDGQRTWSSAEPPNPALATAGTGDVLTGVIASLVAQHHRAPDPIAALRGRAPEGSISLFDCARLAVEAHARAARAWADETGCTGGMTAADLVRHIPGAVESLRG